MAGNGREVALEVLTACRKLDAWSDGSLKAACRRGGLDRREAAFAARLTYGVLQNAALLDFYLGQYCAQPVEKLEPFVRDVLRLGACQILLMDRVPDSAAVSQAVEMVKSHRRQRAAGLVNAVLRKISTNKEHLPAIPAKDPASYLALRYSHPLWLAKRLVELLGREEAEAFLAADNEAAPLVIQHNPLRCTLEELIHALEDGGAVYMPHPWLAGCGTISGGGDLEQMPAFQQGFFRVQDAAARLSVLAAGPKAGDQVLDVCAAPGGKSFAAAGDMGGKGAIIACDIHPHKLTLMEKGAQRLGIACMTTQLADGRENRPEWNDAFDVVLCDVPCSGLGVIRKKPEIRYKDPQALKGLPAVQRAILENACRYVRPGGVLLYSTCTILPEENEGVSDAFLAGHPEFAAVPFTLHEGWEAPEGKLTLWPQRHGTDGFYLCKMSKL